MRSFFVAHTQLVNCTQLMATSIRFYPAIFRSTSEFMCCTSIEQSEPRVNVLAMDDDSGCIEIGQARALAV